MINQVLLKVLEWQERAMGWDVKWLKGYKTYFEMVQVWTYEKADWKKEQLKQYINDVWCGTW